MKEERASEIKKNLSYYDYGHLKDAITLINRAEKHNIDLDELREYIKFIESYMKEHGRSFLHVPMYPHSEEMMPDCPECGHHPYELIRIPGCQKGPGNIHGYKTVFFCDGCGHHEYSTKNFGEQYDLLAKNYDKKMGERDGTRIESGTTGNNKE